MDHYEEGMNAMWEEVEGNKKEPVLKQTDEERWKQFVDEYGKSGYVIQTEFGIVDTSEDGKRDVFRGEHLTHEEYLQAIFNSRNSRRTCFEHCYYNYACCYFKGQINRFDKKRGKVIFNRIYISATYTDGDGYKGKEEHVWMDSKPFECYQIGDCISFGGEIYRYLKTRNGKQIAFGIRKPYNISRIEPDELPSEEEMIIQAIDQIICEICIYNEHCYMGNCIASKEWREEMRTLLTQIR